VCELTCVRVVLCATCTVCELTRPRVGLSATWLSASWPVRELSSNRRHYTVTVAVEYAFASLPGHFFLAFLPREAMLSAVYAVVVCLCVCLSHSGIVSKRLNVGSRKKRHTIAP